MPGPIASQPSRNTEAASDRLIIIPSYRPSPALIGLIRALSGRNVPGIVLIDDGSGPEFLRFFKDAASFPGVYLLHHARNCGKGAALKTGIQFAMRRFPALAGVVTADADGQHHAEDIQRMLNAAAESPDLRLLLGARSFQGHVPFRSRFGNTLTRSILRSLIGWPLTDTQTGLRAIPAVMLPHLLQLGSERYEFELEMLLLAHHLAIPIAEMPIRTIYENGNQSSHFRPLSDSARIYGVLLRFAAASWRDSRLSHPALN